MDIGYPGDWEFIELYVNQYYEPCGLGSSCNKQEPGYFSS